MAGISPLYLQLLQISGTLSATDPNMVGPAGTASDDRDDRTRRSMLKVGQVTAGLAAAVMVVAAGCSSSSKPNNAVGTAATRGRVAVVAGENEYGNVAEQIGGAYVTVYSVDSNPNTDPHTYEATPAVARKIAQAKLLVENGVGYDDFMSKLASASPNSARQVINVQHLLALPDSTPNPHLWYDPTTMPAVAQALVSDLSALDPAHAATFQANETKFMASMQPWLTAIASFKAKYPGTKAATTEPVADYLLTAMGISNLTPFGFQADIMNGTDPSPQDVSLENGFFARHQAKVFCYNQQVTDALTDSIRQTALKAGVPVVGVYETMPTPGYDYQSWMTAEVAAIEKAITTGASTQHL
jgi:zinc/manganese transport system substrate-binding protein